MARKKSDEVVAPAETPALPELQFEVRVGEFQKALGDVVKAVGTRHVIPVLGNILVTEDGGRLRLSATDLEWSVNRWLSAKIAVPGAISLPAKTLVEVVNILPKEAVLSFAMSLSTQSANLKAMSRRMTLKGIDAQEFPLTCHPECDKVVTLPGKFLEEVKRVLPAAATDEARPVLAALALHISEDGAVRMEGADGFRLHRNVIQTEARGFAATLLLPAKVVKNICGLLNSDEPLSLGLLPQGSARLAQGNFQIISQVIEGNYPDLNAVIPKVEKATTRVTVARRVLLATLRAADPFAREAGHIMRMKVVNGTDTESGYLHLHVTNAETGNFEDRLDATVEGETLLIGVNGHYMRECLEAYSSETITLYFTNATSPILIDRDWMTVVVMPMQLGR